MLTDAREIADAARSFKGGDDATANKAKAEAMKMALDDALRKSYFDPLRHLTWSFFRPKGERRAEMERRERCPFQTGLAKTTTPAGCWKKVQKWLRIVEDFDREAQRVELERTELERAGLERAEQLGRVELHGSLDPLQPLALNAFTLKLEPVEKVGNTLTEEQVEDMFKPFRGDPSRNPSYFQVVNKKADEGWTMKEDDADAHDPIRSVKKVQRDMCNDQELDRQELERYTRDQCQQMDVRTLLKRKLKILKKKKKESLL